MSHIIQRETAGMIFAMGRSSRCCPSAIHNPKFEVSSHRKFHESTSRRHLSSWKDLQLGNADRPAWSDEWKLLGLGAKLVDDVNATKACVRAVRNAIEFNSIPGVIQHIPGGRNEMLIHVKLGVPAGTAVDRLQVAKVFPYGKLLPIEVGVGGLEFHSGRVVKELGDADDIGICCVACVSIGYNDDDHSDSDTKAHKTFSTKDGY